VPQNNSDTWLYLSQDGKTVVEGQGNPEAATLLAAPGGTVDQIVVDKHDLAGQLGGASAPMYDSVGNPVVLVDGVAYASDILPEGHPAKVQSVQPVQAPRPNGLVQSSPAPVLGRVDPAKAVPVDAPRPTAIHSPTSAPVKVQTGTQGSPKGGS